MKQTKRFGLSCASATPFRADMTVDAPLLVRHARWLLDQGCDSITLFGTTGEGASLAPADRIAMLGALDGAGIIMRSQVVAGIMANTPNDADDQLKLAYDAGCRAILLAPPSYFKDVSDDGVFRWVAMLLERAGPRARDIILYHIPQMTGVAFSIALVDRLKKAFPGVIIGVKDSAAIWEQTEALIKAHGDLAILVGAESQLAAAVKLGGQGTICGYANTIPASLRDVAGKGKDHPDIARMGRVTGRYHFLQEVKAMIAHIHGEPGWLNLRPPLVSVPKAAERAIVKRFRSEFPA
ncbi:MAG TPA: dihydrodipicolinate synthase family protein [Beijerinckiaceae bacterium]|nr:dihydrodipicolinate synthase family protein [Beijerinckiaceae bacterium]